jgi:hypothetical protein
MAARFSGASPQTIWIVGRLEGEGTLLGFPADTTQPLIRTLPEDESEAALDLFDSIGLQVWLQVEPGNAPVEDLIHLVLERYGHHPCVVGFGVDVEWYQSVDEPAGKPVSDEQAKTWLAAVQSHSKSYKLFLKHWEIEKMPPTLREGLYFVDDSQIFPSLEAMVDEFEAWGRAFAPAPVGFQFGYKSDQPWWEKLGDPPLEIGRKIIDVVPNLGGLYWVDFTVLQVFPVDSADRMVGIKIYDPEGGLEEIFARWQDLHINTAFVSEALLENAEFRELARRQQIDTFVIVPVFFNPEDLERDRDLYAITAKGAIARDDWVEFACPSRQGYRDTRVREIVELVDRHRPDGLSLDFIRHFVFWEMMRPETAAEELPNTCFCPHCLAGFASHTGIEVPPELSDTGDRADWILAHHPTQWRDWKVQLITSMVERVVAEVKVVDPSIQINLHAVPWRRDDYRGAIRNIAGQDLEALSSLTDYLSPMTYSFMLRREPTWIHSVVQDLASSSTAKIVPSIQVKEAYRLQERLSSEEFESALREALRYPSSGVIFWSWAALAQEPAKQRIVREVLAGPGQT